MSPAPRALDPIPPEALDPATTPIDYIVVGSGPGGAPVASRLARAGMRVLVLEAGTDPGADPDVVDPAQRHAEENERALYHCPGLHAAATEPHEHDKEDRDAWTDWSFDVHHYTDPSIAPVLYPRASALGGCTAHHAMVSIYGLDSDWRSLADLTGDESWAPQRMRALYQRIERSIESRSTFRGSPLRLLLWLGKLLARDSAARAERGRGGWLDVTLPDPKVVVSDRWLLWFVASAVIQAEGLETLPRLARLAKRFLGGSLARDFDLNDARTMRESPEGVTLVPMALSRGIRRGPRELLLETRRELRSRRREDPLAGELHLVTGAFVRRILFDCDAAPPRAIGVELQLGARLYRAASEPEPPQGEPLCCFARREILVCGGAFNSPQLLMLSGIGDVRHLRASGVRGLADARGAIRDGSFIDLPGVGGNLRDRCEISVITETKEDFRSLDGVEFDLGPEKVDRALATWRATAPGKARAGIYATNGAALAIVKRSAPEVLEPDLLLLGLPIAFRGYFRRWSRGLLSKQRDGTGERSQRLWSWVLLKAYSSNRGTVRLRSADPFEPPEIQFRFFGDRADGGGSGDPDMEALVRGVAYVRGLNRGAARRMKGADPVHAELQPGPACADDTDELRAWIAREAWGHHAAGTCAIGRDPWRSTPAELVDEQAVLDGKFRVHGVRGLRVVDASVFPSLPGYFLVTPIYVVSEKAADTILDELPV